MAAAGGDPPTAFPLWRQFVHIAPAWLLWPMTGLTRIVPHRPWRQVAAWWHWRLRPNLGLVLVQGRGGPRPGALDYVAWLSSLSTPTTTISSSYGGALPFLVDAVHIDALGLSTPYIARHGTFDPDGPQDSKTDMRWVVEQRPDIIEGYLSGKALLRGGNPKRSVGPLRRKMILEMVSSPRFQRDYVFVRNAPYDRMDRAAFSARRLLRQSSTARHARLRACQPDSARRVRWPVRNFNAQCLHWALRIESCFVISCLRCPTARLSSAIVPSGRPRSSALETIVLTVELETIDVSQAGVTFGRLDVVRSEGASACAGGLNESASTRIFPSADTP
jgi:hypothetical protein